MKTEKIAVLGGGGAGTVAAWLLNKKYDVTLFEANSYLGGHAYSHPIQTTQGEVFIDMGVELFNERIAPNVCALLKHFSIDTYVVPLSFFVDLGANGASWSNLTTDGRLYQALRGEFDRFHRGMSDIIHSADPKYKRMTLRQYLGEEAYSKEFTYLALLPLLTVYSGCHAPTLDYTLLNVAISFHMNLLSFFAPGYWRKAKGGIHCYFKKIAAELGDRVRLNTPLQSVQPTASALIVRWEQGEAAFDKVVFATHADVALKLLHGVAAEYKTLLGSFEYVPVESVCHQDPQWLLGQEKNNYCLFQMPAKFDIHHAENHYGCLTRHNNVLMPYQNIAQPLLVSFDPKMPIAAEAIRCRQRWQLPKLRPMDFQRKTQLNKIQGKHNIWFCGTDFSVTGHDGAIASAMVIAERLGVPYPFANDFLANTQYHLVKEIMGVYTPTEKMLSGFHDAIFWTSKVLNLHQSQAYRFIKNFMV